MAYNYFPATYQPTYQSSYPYYPQQQTQQRQTVQQGLVLVQSEQEARAYPVAPGNSITFKDESGPYCYVKTMGVNQFDRPTFDKYRLVKEDVQAEPEQTEQKEVPFALKADIENVWKELESVRAKLTELSEKRQVKKKKEDDDE